MCGRYRLSRRKQLVEEYFDTSSDEMEWTPRYNIAPTQPVPVIRQNPKEPRRELSLMRWGLIPSWAKDSSTASQVGDGGDEACVPRSIDQSQMPCPGGWILRVEAERQGETALLL
jgi:putative SOS response-associated peptidase YedK